MEISGRYNGYYFALLIPLVGCWTCIKYAHKFAKISKNKNKKEALIRSDFEPLIDYFMKHWNETHLNTKIFNKQMIIQSKKETISQKLHILI